MGSETRDFRFRLFTDTDEEGDFDGISVERYVTRMTETIGMRINVVEIGKLMNSTYRINLANQPKGSSFGNFYNVVAENSIVSFVTAQDRVYLIDCMEDTEFVVEKAS